MISVAITYFNRKKHLINTLKSFNKSEVKEFEVIVVDDASDDEHRIEDLLVEFPFLKLIRIEKKDKFYTNPSIPLNIAISNTNGNIIIIQNPECFHYSDIFKYVEKNISKNKYFAFGTTNKDVVNLLDKINWKNDYHSEINKLISINPNEGPPINSWYCHSKFRPQPYNFCSAIMREDLKELNGFDERYAFGVDRDDVEFLTRLKRKKIDIKIIDNIIVIHQSHKSFYYLQNNVIELRSRNFSIYNNITEKESIIRVNPNKQIIK